MAANGKKVRADADGSLCCPIVEQILEKLSKETDLESQSLLEAQLAEVKTAMMGLECVGNSAFRNESFASLVSL